MERLDVGLHFSPMAPNCQQKMREKRGQPRMDTNKGRGVSLAWIRACSCPFVVKGNRGSGFHHENERGIQRVAAELFPVDRAQPLADIERRMDGSPLRRLVADCLHEQLAAGLAGYRALANAIASSVKAWMQRAGHQMEEHYLRHPESSLSRAIDFRDRLAAAIQQVPVPDLVKKIIAPQSRRGSGPMQRRGLDEGVSFK